MIVVMRRGAAEAEVADVVRHLNDAGCRVRRDGMERVVLGATGGAPEPSRLADLPGVETVRDGGQYVLASRAMREENSVFDLGNGVTIGGPDLLVIAGPCSVEDEESLDQVAGEVAAAGARGLRAGAYKPRTGPYAFQGLGEEGYYLLRKAADRHGLLVVSEVLEPQHLPLAEYYCDVLQVGARNMQNGALLRELGRSRKPVLLKRGLSATIDEWLAAAEYVLSAGNERVILCERGIRTFETATRNTLDLSAVPALRERTHLP
ncbi:MAG TPA: bifunctional 3-deoxy-7-phosphoheptulonate synthase/chorismate mutase, partial [Longimicrobiales bacterium]|nr:bifunctional 3-deoxy-7-phosphoheptulonate synthase/chorismate mutase [Longimicrobiales bacterium]